MDSFSDSNVETQVTGLPPKGALLSSSQPGAALAERNLRDSLMDRYGLKLHPGEAASEIMNQPNEELESTCSPPCGN